MRCRTFFEPPIVYVGFLLFCILSPCFFFLCAFCAATDSFFTAALVFVFMAVFCGGSVFWYVESRQDCITVKEDYVVWRCLFRRTRRLYYDDCRDIGVETFNKEARRPIVRGDECAAVYLSMDPFPEEFKGRINHLRCSDRIIKFYYTDALAEAILEVAPKEKTYLLRAFYNQMQNADRQREQHRKQRKKRKR